jgi:hypothetical protein
VRFEFINRRDALLLRHGKKNTDKIVFDHIKVLDAGAKGVSVAKAPDGKVIFIPNVVPGDVVDVQTFKKRKAYYEGKAIQFHEFSEHRVEPICEHFGVCGGCKWQNMNYSQQLFYKQNEVKNHLQRIGKVELPEFEPILGSEKQFFYRNKMGSGSLMRVGSPSRKSAATKTWATAMRWVSTSRKCGTRSSTSPNVIYRKIRRMPSETKSGILPMKKD